MGMACKSTSGMPGCHMSEKMAGNNQFMYMQQSCFTHLIPGSDLRGDASGMSKTLRIRPLSSF